MDNGEPQVVVVAPDDEERHANLASHIGNIQNLWDDRALASPLIYYAATYLNPKSLVFDICDGGGVFAVVHVQYGWRAQFIGALWSRDAVRATHDGEIWKSCGRAAMITHDLLVLDAITAVDNKLARRSMKRMGMRFRGLIDRALCYNGTWKAAAWYEIDRAALITSGASNGRPSRDPATASTTGV